VLTRRETSVLWNFPSGVIVRRVAWRRRDIFR
jgi:hypothetical protein